MNPLFQLSTRTYDKEIVLVKRAMDELGAKCGIKDGYRLGEPKNTAGWTFFDVQLGPEMFAAIETSGMMEGARGYRIGEQTKNFLGHFLEQYGSRVRIKQIGY